MENRIRFLGNRLGYKSNFDGALYDPNYCSPTLLSRDYKGAKEIIDIRKVDIVRDENTIPSRAEQSRAEQSRAEQLNRCIRLGNAYDDEKFNGGNFGGNVWDENGLAPTMKTGASASQQCHIEVKKMKEQQGIQIGDWFGVLETDNKPKIKIRQATKDGFIDCEIPGVADLNYASSTTRRGRVVRGGQISPTLTTENIPSVIELGDPDFYNFLYEIDGEIYLIRIRKLTPKECWKLMGFSDEDFEKAESVNSNTRLYQQAGNSIVKNVLVALMGQFFEGKEDVYKTM